MLSPHPLAPGLSRSSSLVPPLFTEELEVSFPHSFSFQPGLYPAGLQKAQPWTRKERKELGNFSLQLFKSTILVTDQAAESFFTSETQTLTCLFSPPV